MGDLTASPLHMISAIINAPRFHREIEECPPEITERCVHLLTALGRSRELAIQTNYEVMEFLTRVISPFDDAGYMRVSRYFVQELLTVVGPQHKLWGAISYVMLSATPHVPEGDQLKLWKRINARFFEVLLDSRVISNEEEKRLKVKSVRGEPGTQPDLELDDAPSEISASPSQKPPTQTTSQSSSQSQEKQASPPSDPPEVVQLLGGVPALPPAPLANHDFSDTSPFANARVTLQDQISEPHGHSKSEGRKDQYANSAKDERIEHTLHQEPVDALSQTINTSPSTYHHADSVSKTLGKESPERTLRNQFSMISREHVRDQKADTQALADHNDPTGPNTPDTSQDVTNVDDEDHLTQPETTDKLASLMPLSTSTLKETDTHQAPASNPVEPTLQATHDSPESSATIVGRSVKKANVRSIFGRHS